MNRHPFHILLLSIFPVIYLYSLNADETHLRDLLWPSVILLCCAVILWLVLKLILGDGRKAGIVTSLSILYFFSYGPIASLLYSAGLCASPDRMRIRYAILWVLLYLAAVVLILFADKGIKKLTRIVNIAATLLVVTSIGSAAYFSIDSSEPANRVSTHDAVADKSEKKPDIYYILVDGYGSADVLNQLFGIDNSSFITFLRDRGFYVADSSRSNYVQTLLSLASSLNMTYIGDRIDRSYEKSADRTPLVRMINNNEVMDFLDNLGYSSISFSSGISSTEMTTADLHLSGRWVLTEFEQVLIALTPVPRITSKLRMQYSAHRNRLRFVFDNLPKIPEMNGPVFVFAHVIAPHPPFVFDSDGREINADRPFVFADGSHFREYGASIVEYRSGYAGYLAWLNGKLIESIDSILARSTIPPIIILHADHGPGSKLDWASLDKSDVSERTAILNAIYTGEFECPDLYPSISPVNIFRAVFNCAFGTNLDVLADRSFYSAWATPYRAIDVADRLDVRDQPDSLVH